MSKMIKNKKEGLALSRVKGLALSRVEGFTLIEMLVVIAMIGLLAAVVLVALGPSRNKAKDTRIISDVNQIRAVMETLYNPSTNSYGITEVSSNTCASSTSNSAIDNAFTDIHTNDGSMCSISVNGDKYAVSAEMASGPTYCVDSSGYVGSSAAKNGACSSSNNPNTCSQYGTQQLCTANNCTWNVTTNICQ